MQAPSTPSRDGPALWAIGGGKGGVGKSFVAANLAIRLAQLGKRVFVVDGDLGGANLDTILGCDPPPSSLNHFFARKVKRLEDIAVETQVERLYLIAGDSETLGSANPAHSQKLKLVRHLRALPADIVVLDLGAGTSFNTLDLYLAADLQLAVTTPEPTSVQNCFAFFKASTLRDLERRTGVKRRDLSISSLRQFRTEGEQARLALGGPSRLIVNRSGPSEGRRVTNLLHDLAGRFLGSRVQLVGIINDDPSVSSSIRRMSPLCVSNPAAPAAVGIAGLAKTLLEPPAGENRSGTMCAGVNEEIDLHGIRLHLQTEDLGGPQCVRTQVFAKDGSVLYSRKTPYSDRFFSHLAAAEGDRVRFHHVAIRKALMLGRIDLRRRAG